MADEENKTESRTAEGISPQVTASDDSKADPMSLELQVDHHKTSSVSNGSTHISIPDPTSEANGISSANSNSSKRVSDPPDENIEPLESPVPPDEIQGPPSAKDGGYGWVVVLMVFMVNMITAGYIKSFGITYTLILDYFPDTSGAVGGWVMGLLVGCRGLLSPVMGALTVVIGPRKTVVLGTLICVSGLVLAVPAFSITYLAFTLGAVVGTGMCMAETPGFLVVTDYFEEKRALANGFRAAGNPMGGVLFAPMIVLLQQYFGLRGAFMMVAGLMLQLVIFGMLMRPFEQHKKLVESKYWRKMQREDPSLYLQISSLKAQQPVKEKKKKKPIDFTYLKNPNYLIYLFMVMCTNAAMPNALFYAPIYGRSIGLTDLQNSIIASYTSCCDFGMRIACGWIFSMNFIKKRHGFIGGIVIGGLGCLSVPLCTQMWHLFFFATMLSLCMAFFWTLLNVLLADQFGGDDMASTWGFFRMVQGILSFLYPSIVGFIMDVSGGLTVPFLFMGFMLILGATIFSLQPLVAKLSGTKFNFT